MFTRSGAVWSQQAYVKASRAYSGFFGRSVALTTDGATLAVGADYEGAEPSASAASNGEASDLLGNAIALSADGSTLTLASRQSDRFLLLIIGWIGDAVPRAGAGVVLRPKFVN